MIQNMGNIDFRTSFTVTSSVASPICQEGQSEKTLLDFYLFLPDFSSFFPDFGQFFRCQGWHSAPLHPQWLRHWLLLHNNGLYWSKTVIFEFLENISDQIHMILCPKLLHFFEKMHKVFKNKVQGCCTPLKSNFNFIFSGHPELHSLRDKKLQLVSFWPIITIGINPCNKRYSSPFIH